MTPPLEVRKITFTFPYMALILLLAVLTKDLYTVPCNDADMLKQIVHTLKHLWRVPFDLMNHRCPEY